MTDVSCQTGVELLMEIAEYLLQGRVTDLEVEVRASDQAGPWDERDDLLDDVKAAKAHLQRIREYRTRSAGPPRDIRDWWCQQ